MIFYYIYLYSIIKMKPLIFCLLISTSFALQCIMINSSQNIGDFINNINLNLNILFNIRFILILNFFFITFLILPLHFKTSGLLKLPVNSSSTTFSITSSILFSIFFSVPYQMYNLYYTSDMEQRKNLMQQHSLWNAFMT